ncbi:hypothetical protein Corgl_1747 [Coriobacterium glomerans PW2]|uniref:Uncharacterized protein n=1 Tax=Coriobacterium glomerans (strain ATCC 49209 / DSM 20642 / JCM 10262 / PW2) TaxID=700015 RepID=F2N994_CORGP|nr:hypothetical protein Corgl_1747 [Coriobacterium glomerans PW2]
MESPPPLFLGDERHAITEMPACQRIWAGGHRHRYISRAGKRSIENLAALDGAPESNRR